MKVLLAAVLTLLMSSVGAAYAQQQDAWYINQTNHDYECNHFRDDGFAIGPFASLQECETALGPSTGVVCQDGTTRTVAWPNVYARLNEGVTVGACENGGGGGGRSSIASISHGSASFLCYSVGGEPYVAGDVAQALLLEAAGYWLPTAVAGNVAGGTNIGAFHLVCENPGTPGADGNAPAASQYVDDNGAVVDVGSAASSFWVGVYPLESA